MGDIFEIQLKDWQKILFILTKEKIFEYIDKKIFVFPLKKIQCQL